MGRRRRIERFRRLIANPIASVVLVGVLVGDSLTLPREMNPTAAGNVVGIVLDELFQRARATDPNMMASKIVYVVHEARGMRVLAPDAQSWDELSDILSTGQVPVAECMARDTTSRAGLWAHAHERHFRGVDMRPLTGAWSDADIDAARAALFVESNMPPATWRTFKGWGDIAKADQVSGRLLWGGVAHDVFALLIFVTLLYSFTGWPAWIAARPWSRTARRRARGLCPACGYDLSGNEVGVCPECGGKTGPRT